MSNKDQEVPGTSEQAEQLFALQEAHEALESERNELSRKVESLEAELAAAQTESQESETTIQALREEFDNLVNQSQTLEHPDTIALLFLEKNCERYRITRHPVENIITVEGVLRGEQCGYVTHFVPRVYRSSGKPPYLIHPEDTFKCYRTIEFKYSSVGEDLAQAVEGIIITYCPGDVEVGKQPFYDDREAEYGNKASDYLKVWVQCSIDESLEDFLKLPEAGDNPDLNDHNVLHRKVPGR